MKSSGLNAAHNRARAQAALQQADYVAWNVWASICGRPLLPFKYQHLGELMSLGSGGIYSAPVPAAPARARCAPPLMLPIT
jgi:NADH dehydrogenase FAD-containing subunit